MSAARTHSRVRSMHACPASVRLRRAEEIVAQLHSRGLALDSEREARLEQLRLFARVEQVIPGARLRHDVPPIADADNTLRDDRCAVCHRRAWWRSIHGALVCGVCHPPASAELVAAWLGDHDA